MLLSLGSLSQSVTYQVKINDKKPALESEESAEIGMMLIANVKTCKLSCRVFFRNKD